MNGYPEIKSLYIDELDNEWVIRNATVKSTHLGFEDHGMFSFNINFVIEHYGNQGTGHYLIGETKANPEDATISAEGAKKIRQIVEFFCGPYGKWENLPGKRVHLLYEDYHQGDIQGFVSTDDLSKVLWLKK